MDHSTFLIPSKKLQAIYIRMMAKLLFPNTG